MRDCTFEIMISLSSRGAQSQRLKISLKKFLFCVDEDSHPADSRAQPTSKRPDTHEISEFLSIAGSLQSHTLVPISHVIFYLRRRLVKQDTLSY